jgi:broad specificity phosphatase PhoE
VPSAGLTLDCRGSDYSGATYRVSTGFHIHDDAGVRPAFLTVKRISMMSVILTLICHASTQAVRNAAFPVDEPLDPQGHAKASAAAADMRRVDAAWTSPALRARQTAAALELNATVDPTLRDIDFGVWSGRSLVEVEATDPVAVAAWMTDCSAAPHGGESIIDLLRRIAPWFETVAGAEGRVVAVTHPSVIRAAIILALDAKPDSFWRIDIPPLCRARLRGNAGRWTLLSIGA